MLLINRQFLIYIAILIQNVLGSSNIILLDTVSGTIGRGNFTYWSLGYVGHIILILTSVEGDADLYTTDKNHKPSYEPDQYDLHSATCGIDFVEIPKNFKRPVGIGIYGHPSHENSSYILEVYYDREKSQYQHILDQDSNNLEEHSNVGVEDERDSFNSGIKKYRIKAKLLSGIWSLLEIFDIIFTF